MSAKKPRLSLIILEFLGSMNLAIMLLCAVGLASIIGTILQQNQPYQDYLIRFGPFWFEVFEKLGLYDVYASPWFLCIMAFMVISTTVCVYRNTPGMLREMANWRDDMQRRSLTNMKLHQQMDSGQTQETSRDLAAAVLQRGGFQVRAKQQGEAILVSAKKGFQNRWGYILTHLSIVVICVGGLLDSSYQFNVREKLGLIKLETRNIPASDVPQESWLDTNNWSFRGNVNLPEGDRANLVFISVRDGYLVQELPFEIELKDFRIEHYKTGQPKSFESDLVIHDDDLDEPLETTISVNHPLIYKGHAIYQASFNDGGTPLTLKTWPLLNNAGDRQDIQTAVFEQTPLTLAGVNYQLEIEDFRLFNINPAEEGSDKKFVNFGPNFTYRLRAPSGQALEYVNYMSPIEFDGRFFFTSGVRSSPAEPFRYLHIPADENFSLDTFMRFLNLIQNPETLRHFARQNVEASMADDENKEQLSEPLINSMVLLTSQFAYGGYAAIIQEMEKRVPEERRQEVFSAYLKVLNSILSEVFQSMYEEPVTEEQWGFYEASKEAINAAAQYQSPIYFQLTNFNHRQASGLQITKSPGKFWVYLGSSMLMIGVFMLFYIARRRIWVWIEQGPEGTSVLISGQSHRKTGDFPQEFEQLSEHLKQTLTASQH